MKIKSPAILFLSFLIINIESYPQLINNISDFPWKTSKKDVMTLMRGLDSIKLNSDGDDFVVFENGNFGDISVKYWSFRFFNDQLYDVAIVPEYIFRNDTTAIDDLKKSLFVEHSNLADYELYKYESPLYLFDDSMNNLVGIVEVDTNPDLSYGDRIRIIFRYFPLILEMDIRQNVKPVY